VVARCNAAFRIANRERRLSDFLESQKNPNTGEFDRHWDTIQGVRLGMNDVLLQTKEDWTYPVQTSKVVALIETRLIKQSH
jgi:hypothetical protein